MNSETTARNADKSEAEQFMAGWVGLMVCGLVAAIIWFFAIKSVWSDGSVEAAALDCASIYGISETDTCATP